MKVKKLLEPAAGKPSLSSATSIGEGRPVLCGISHARVDKSLSGGEVKRIEIATMLARDPKMAIYDEPEAGIDLWSFDRLTETFRDIHETRDDRSIASFPTRNVSSNSADDIVCLRDGRIQDMGPREEILPKLGFTDRGFHGCQLTQPTELHLTEISTNC
ncbi:MAG: ATP-binding cassette domain-containing protein [Slackia sp.]